MARVSRRHERHHTPPLAARSSSHDGARDATRGSIPRSGTRASESDSLGDAPRPLGETPRDPVNRSAGRAPKTLDPTSIPQDQHTTKGKSMRGAGGGSFPNPHGIRRNHKPLREVVKLRTDVTVAAVPEPALPLSERGRELWSRVWTHPVAQLWTEADVGGLSRMVALQADPDAHSDPKILAEIRQLEDRYLLNPYARRAQRIELLGDEEETVDTEVLAIAHYRRMLGAETN